MNLAARAFTEFRQQRLQTPTGENLRVTLTSPDGDSQLVQTPVGVEKVRDRNVLLAAINAGIEFSSHFNYVAASVLSTVG